MAAALDLRHGLPAGAARAGALELAVIWLPAAYVAERARATSRGRAAWMLVFATLWCVPPALAYLSHLAQPAGRSLAARLAAPISPPLRLYAIAREAGREGSFGGAWDVEPAQLALEGPLDGLRLRTAGGLATQVELELLAGEQRRLVVPLAVPPGLPRELALGALELTFEPAAGTARCAPADPEPRPVLSPALLARPRPAPLAPREPLPVALVGLSAASVLVAAFGVAVRGRRIGFAGLAGLVALALFLRVRRAPEAHGTTVIELAMLADEAPLLVAGALLRSASGGFEGSTGQVARLEIVGAAAPPELQVDARPGGAADRFSLAVPSGLVRAWERLDAEPWSGVLLEGRPRPSLEGLWERAPNGSWGPLGPWPADETRPRAPDGALPDLPAWLAGGLPPGLPVRVAPLRPGPLGEDGAAWLRAVGG
jgi:hypothetical protein